MRFYLPFITLIFFLNCSSEVSIKDINLKIKTSESYPGSSTIIHSGIVREYYVYRPLNLNATSNSPIMFNFHGGSGNIAGAIEMSDMRSLADDNGFILVYPQGIGDPTDESKPAPVWTYKTDLATTAVDNLGFIKAIIVELAAQFDIDQDRIYACGYSNGGEFSQELAIRLSSSIAAIASVSASMNNETYIQSLILPSHPLAVLTINGTEDFYYQYNGTPPYFISLDKLNNYWVNHNQCNSMGKILQVENSNINDGSLVERHRWNNEIGDVYVEHLKVIGGGHDWPGSIGNMDINSNEEIWRFVSQYDVSGIR
jgi:polyhydroxybutyrate depolymerase